MGNVGFVPIISMAPVGVVLKIKRVRPMVTDELLTLVDGAVEMLSDARTLAIESQDPAVRLMLTNVIMQIEAHRPDLQQKYGLPDEAGCEAWHDCADRDVPVGCVGCPCATRLEG